MRRPRIRLRIDKCRPSVGHVSLTTRRAIALISVVVLGALAFWAVPAVTLSSRERAEVQAAMVSRMEADTALGQLPDDLDSRQRVVTSERQARRSALEQIWVPARVDALAEEWDEGLASVAEDPAYESYFDNRLRVTKWENVRWTFGGVLLTFTGHMDYRGRQWSGWSQETPTRYRVELQRAGSDPEWRLVSVTGEKLGGP